MGSLRKRLRALNAAHLTLADAPALVKDALANKGKPPVPPYLTRRFIHGWEVILSCFDHATSGEPDSPTAEHWHCSCQLWPHARCSDTADWEMLGRITAALAMATGMTAEDGLRALTDIATANPSGVHHFIWHKDGQPCVILPAIRQAQN